jgi:hypothetical protein
LELNIRPETLKLAQKRTGNTLAVIGISKDFLTRTQVARKLRERKDKWNFIKLKNFFFLLFYYSYVHTRLGSFLPLPPPPPLPPTPLPPSPPHPLNTQQKLFCPYL